MHLPNFKVLHHIMAFEPIKAECDIAILRSMSIWKQVFYFWAAFYIVLRNIPVFEKGIYVLRQIFPPANPQHNINNCIPVNIMLG